ncbi:MAG: UDP-N-acetylmuramoyl-tripeptide--D-alanyl-D-alanine ligase [Candidatus Hydrogenedentes bacterium]|nr:UDP-N-acetylmuramoyl-tripeptide--D-alanyl-D-alanine ligase [Candidatus Hydrogenedentota bacterium]
MNWSYSLADLAKIIGAEPPAKSVVFQSISTDTRTLCPGDLFFALSGARFDGASFVPDAFAKGACAAVSSRPSENGPVLVVSEPLRALQVFAAHHRRRWKIPVLAITGSCGKTMSKDLVAAVLSSKYRVVKTQGNLNNEIGCPLSLLQLNGESQFAVIEMGANHLGEVARLCALARPTESAITMIAPAHLEGFGTLANVARAKAEIVESLPVDGTFYVNADDPRCVAIGQRFSGKKVRFGHSGEVVLEACEFVSAEELRLHVAPVGELRLPLQSRAHATNVLLAVAVGVNHGITEFEGPLRAAGAASTRMKVLRVGPLEILDDTYNANPASMAAALHALMERPGHGTRIAVLGDMWELGAAAGDLHRDLGRLAGKLGVQHLFATGRYACDTIAGAGEVSLDHAEIVSDHQTAANAVRAVAQPGDVLLVKGSRIARMEQVIAQLRELYRE